MTTHYESKGEYLMRKGIDPYEQVDLLEAHNLKLTDANVRLSDEILSLQAKLEQIDNHWHSNTKVIITNRVREKDAEIERLQKRVSDADECIKEQEEMLEHLIVDQSQREKEIERLQADNELLSKLNQEYGAEIERLRAALEDNLKHVLLADAENERLQSRLRDRQNALDHAIDYGNRADEKIERLKEAYDMLIGEERYD